LKYPAGVGQKRPFMLLVDGTETTAKQTSIRADVQEVLAEPFPGAVAQGLVRSQ